jgi:hypothetical protein
MAEVAEAPPGIGSRSHQQFRPSPHHRPLGPSPITSVSDPANPMKTMKPA